MLERSPRPAVLVFEHPERGKLHGSVFGDVITHIALRYGAIGCVSNGAVRDAAPTKRLGFQLFANGTVASHANNTTLRAGEEVTISGMRVRTGDLLFGDENGVVCIPRELRIADVLARCEAIKHSEAARIARAEAADFTLDEL
jgi:4-hydroxy-4-methyl-2-oxoglutarate aldolase